MKFRVERDVLAEAVTWVARALPSNPPVPVLAGLLLEASPDGILRLSSFDYEVSARIEVAADVADPGTVLVSGRLLADISRSLPTWPVDVATDGSRVELTCGASRFTLLTMPVDDYPSLPAMPDAAGVIAGHDLTQAVSQVTVAASRDDTRPVLTGVQAQIDGEKLTLMATDRYRLAVRTLPWRPATPGMQATALVRARTLSEVSKALGAIGDVTVALPADGAGELIGFEAGGRRTTSLLMDGEYPQVLGLFPSEHLGSAEVSTSALAEAARRVSLVAGRHAAVRLRFGDGAIVLEAGQGEDAQASEAVEAALSGDEVVLAFNPQYLLEGLSGVAGEVTRLTFTQPTKPVVISSAGEHEATFRYLVLPVRLNS
ncbi:MAG: DNA polymerase III subunit beta [Kineosporiaceae bacterium]|nr:DNA polymerase III subunit beta [Kineosporiaceae bacterium]